MRKTEAVGTKRQKSSAQLTDCIKCMYSMQHDDDSAATSSGVLMVLVLFSIGLWHIASNGVFEHSLAWTMPCKPALKLTLGQRVLPSEEAGGKGWRDCQRSGGGEAELADGCRRRANRCSHAGDPASMQRLAEVTEGSIGTLVTSFGTSSSGFELE